jgi:hypothetical protein
MVSVNAHAEKLEFYGLTRRGFLRRDTRRVRTVRMVRKSDSRINLIIASRSHIDACFSSYIYLVHYTQSSTRHIDNADFCRIADADFPCIA